jgi:hypothetical protein
VRTKKTYLLQHPAAIGQQVEHAYMMARSTRILMMYLLTTPAICVIAAMVRLFVPKESAQHLLDLRGVHHFHRPLENAAQRLSHVTTHLHPQQVLLPLAHYKVEYIQITQFSPARTPVTSTAGA